MHCLSAIITDTTSLQKDLKLCSVVLTDRYSMIPLTRDFYESEHYTKINLLPRYAEIQTDYFGGCGEQYASVKLGNSIMTCRSINDALRQIGVKAEEGMDEFDTVGLGKYRATEEVIR